MRLLLYILFFFCSFAVAGQNLIQNGDFSVQNSAWIKSGFFQYDDRFTIYKSPFSYSYLANADGTQGNSISGSLYQDFFVPNNTGSITVQLWFRISTLETTSSTAFDTCRVSVIDPLNSANEILVQRFSNLNKNTAYSTLILNIPGIQTNKTWRLRFVGGTDAGLPTVFRFDDITVTANPPSNTSCITWANNIPPSSTVDSAMQVLCSNGIISTSQNAAALSSAITRMEIARCLGKALFGNTAIDFMDNFPNIFPSLDLMNLSDQRFIKLMLYLEYKSAIAPLSGNDDISPFSRDYFYPNWFGTINKSDAMKALLETWDLKPSMLYYEPCGNTYSPIICDMLVSNKNLGWVQRANVLGLLANNIATPCGSGATFGTDNPISYSQFYVSLARLLKYAHPLVGYDDLFIPNVFYTGNLNNNISLERGVFQEYAPNGFHIPSGGVGLDFTISYHSSLTEIPILNNDVEPENKFLRSKLQPLGGGWTHSYNAYIKSLNNEGTTPNKILIYWPDGTIHSYLVQQNKYETKGLTDKLFINSYTVFNQPQEIRIQKGRTNYLFKNIDPAGYNVLSLVKITDAHGHSDTLQYINGYSGVSGLEPQILSKVKDSYSGRELIFSYWPNSNYLKSVNDTLNRFLNFYTNQCTHQLDSSSDAKNQVTRYAYKAEVGSFAYRTYLLDFIQRPKGNVITNNYTSRKIKQTQGGNYVIKVDAVPNYQTPWTQQTSKITATQGNQTITSNYIFDVTGNPINISSETNSSTVVYDTLNRPIIERDLVGGYIRKLRYDANGYLDKIVTIDSLYNDSTKYEYINNPFGEPTSVINYNHPGYSSRETKIYRTLQGDPSRVVENENTGGEIRHNFNYQSDGLLYSYSSPTQHEVGFQYNSFGNLIKVSKFPKNTGGFIWEEFGYDPVSRLTSHIDYENNFTAYQYDNNDNPIKSIADPNGLNLATENTYDINDNVLKVKSPKGHITSLLYNQFTDDLIEEQDGTNRKRWSYNENGSLDTFLTKNNFLFKHSYYNQTDDPGTTLTGLLKYDNIRFYQYRSNRKELYRITNTATSKSNTLWYSDPINRGKWGKPNEMSSSGFFSGPNDIMNYGYDNLDRPTFIAYPPYGGKSYGYQYYYEYTTKQLEALYDAGNTSYRFVKYEYQKDSKELQTIYGNGDTIFHHYDAYNREDSIWAKNKNNQILYAIGYTLDKNGKHIEENTRIFYQGNEVTTLPALSIGQVQTGSYELRNRVQSYAGINYTSDASGNIVTQTSPPVTYTYSPGYENLNIVNNNGTTTTYEYDALGFRRRNNNTYYVVDWQNSGNVVMEAQQNTTPISVYVYARGLICRIDPITDSLFYYHCDNRGSVIAITNQAGQLVEYYKYEPFGKTYAEGGTLTWNNPFQFLGKYGVQKDHDDLYYIKARYYQPSTGRFISEDPEWNTNLFTYADNDPINNFDKNGGFFETALDVISVGVSAYDFYKKPSWKNAGMLAWDIGSVFIPFLPGSYILKGAEATRAAIKYAEVIRDVKKAQSNLLKGSINAYETALSGGKHSGFLKNYLGRTTTEINKAINTLQSGKRGIDVHLDKITNPSKYVPNWNSLLTSHQQSLLNGWKREINNASEQINILKGILGN
jgi:RHS repeat-associated protein